MLLRVLLVGLLFWIIARTFWRMMDGVIEGVTGKRRPSGRGRQAAHPPTKLERDPVCGTYVVPETSLALLKNDHVYHFCSDKCRDQFAER